MHCRNGCMTIVAFFSHKTAGDKRRRHDLLCLLFLCGENKFALLLKL